MWLSLSVYPPMAKPLNEFIADFCCCKFSFYYFINLPVIYRGNIVCMPACLTARIKLYIDLKCAIVHG